MNSITSVFSYDKSIEDLRAYIKSFMDGHVGFHVTPELLIQIHQVAQTWVDNVNPDFRVRVRSKHGSDELTLEFQEKDPFSVNILWGEPSDPDDSIDPSAIIDPLTEE